MTGEWIEGVEIEVVTVVDREGATEYYRVGAGQVTKIEAVEKSGLHANVPYVRVYRNGVPYAEFCQHNIVGVYFKQRAPS
jgi:hypothetical protein